MLSDEELAQRTKGGSAEAFEELVLRYEHRVYAFVLSYSKNPMDAREVTQDTFVKAFHSIVRFDSNRAFGPWLFTIARRKCIDRHRVSPMASTEPVPDLSDLNTPDQAMAAKDDRKALWCLAQGCLSELQYHALWLRYAEEMNVAQVAQVLRKTTIYAKVLLYRARQTLVRRLEESGEEAFAHRRPRPPVRPVARAKPVRNGYLPLPGEEESI